MFRSLLYLIVIVLLGGGLGGCQTYAPQPLDSAAHRALWEARAVDAAQLQAFADTLAPVEQSSAFALDDGVSLAEGEIITLAFNPDLRSARARAAVALANAETAGKWDDPTLSIDAMRIIENVPDQWVIGGMIGFTIPLSGRLPVERDLANAEHETELHRVVASEWTKRAELRAMWAEWSAARLRSELLRDLLDREGSILGVVDRLEAAQALSRLEGRLFRMERATRQSELLLGESRVRELELQLRSEMGLTPEADVALVPQVAAGPPPMTVDDAFARLERSNPTLAVHRSAYDVAEHALHLEIRKQHPDLQIGPAYESDEGQNKIGLGLGIPLPILNANKQGIAIARAEREAVRIEYEAAHERLAGAYAQAVEQHAASAAARALIERELLPLAEAQIADERRLAELGELNVLLTLESVVRAHETRVRLIDATLAEARAAIRLRELLGPNEATATAPTEAQP